MKVIETFSSKPVVPIVAEYRAVSGTVLILYFESYWLEFLVGSVIKIFVFYRNILFLIFVAVIRSDG